MRCHRCAGEQCSKAGRDRFGRQLLRCRGGGRRLTERSLSAFRCFHFPDDVIALAVRYYWQFRLPYAEVVTLLAERGIVVDRSTVFDWVPRFAPLVAEVARADRREIGHIGSTDETYVRVAGVWRYVYRAIDEHGQVIDGFLSAHRDTAAATTFLRTARERTASRPRLVTTDKAACYPPALRLLLPDVPHRTGKILQQRIERDHGHLNGRTYRPTQV